MNDCDPWAADPCLRAGTDYKCWWHGPVTWKPLCSTTCGHGYERFNSSYATEASSMSSSLPTLTLQSSHLADCNAPPAGVVVVDDTYHLNARNPGECTNRNTTGDFEFTFSQADSSGHYPAKVDLHQQGGGFNGHFYFAHMENASDLQTVISGTWSRGADLDGSWVRVWVHVPDYAAWTQQAAYVIDLGDGTTEKRYLQQRRYQNEWVSLGVFQMRGEPTVTLTNELTREFSDDPQPGAQLAGYDDVAWDAVGFQTLAHKPENFVVALGDSYAAGEAAGDYWPWSDNNGHTPIARNACHESANSWIRKTVLAGETSTIGALADANDGDMDLHTLSCSGARSEHLLPYYTVTTGVPPLNGDNRDGSFGQYGTVSQIDAGYLDENTTLVTLSIGGNDMRFGDILSNCLTSGECRNNVIDDHDGDPNDIDSLNTISVATQLRLEQVMPTTLTTVIAEIRDRAPNARIAVFGYPRIFQNGGTCLLVSPSDGDVAWLDSVGIALNDTIETTVNAYPDPNVFYVSLDDAFDGEGACGGNGAITGIVLSNTPGDSGDILGTGWGISQQSFHPTPYGTDLYAQSLEAALAANP